MVDGVDIEIAAGKTVAATWGRASRRRGQPEHDTWAKAATAITTAIPSGTSLQWFASNDGGATFRVTIPDVVVELERARRRRA